MVEAVILAAGFSSRVGVYKLGLDICGKTVIERCMEGMYDICSRIIVVGGYKIEIIADIMKKYDKVVVVYNDRYEEGMFTSIKEGLKHTKAERLFLTPGDHPIISRKLCIDLLSVNQDIVVPSFKGRKGHPVTLNRKIADKILIEPDSSNLRDLIIQIGYQACEVEDEGILIDLDTTEDYMRIVRIFREMEK